jgi:hypothetical protein
VQNDIYLEVHKQSALLIGRDEQNDENDDENADTDNDGEIEFKNQMMLRGSAGQLRKESMLEMTESRACTNSSLGGGGSGSGGVGERGQVDSMQARGSALFNRVGKQQQQQQRPSTAHSPSIAGIAGHPQLSTQSLASMTSFGDSGGGGMSSSPPTSLPVPLASDDESHQGPSSPPSISSKSTSNTELLPIAPSSWTTQLTAAAASTNTTTALHQQQQQQFAVAAAPVVWTAHADVGSGRTYYSNSTTGETTWDKPSSLLPPTPPAPAAVLPSFHSMRKPKGHKSKWPLGGTGVDEASGDDGSDMI